MDDLFGHVPQQRELFAAAAPDPAPARTGPIVHTKETIRAEMLRLLGIVRAAQTMPWSPRELHSHTVMFPYMAEWLKAEGDQLQLEFNAELERLRAATPAPT